MNSSYKTTSDSTTLYNGEALPVTGTAYQAIAAPTLAVLRLFSMSYRVVTRTPAPPSRAMVMMSVSILAAGSNPQVHTASDDHAGLSHQNMPRQFSAFDYGCSAISSRSLQHTLASVGHNKVLHGTWPILYQAETSAQPTVLSAWSLTAVSGCSLFSYSFFH